MARLCDSRRVRWLVVLMVMGAIVLYIAGSFEGFMREKDQTALQHNTGTFHALHVDFHAAIEQNVANNNPNEIFIKHDDKGGREKFVFTTPMTLQERLRRSSLLSSGGTPSTSDALTTRRGNIPSTTTLPPIPNVQGHVQSNFIPVRNQNIGDPFQQQQLQQLQGAQRQQQIQQQPQQIQQQQQQVFTRSSVDVVPKVRVTDVNCAKLFDNDYNELRLAQQYQKDNQKVPVPDEEYSKLTQDCDKFKRERQYILQPLNQEEADFPIAFSLVVFKDVEQIERLLRAIYRPQNYYCLHVDTKSSQKVKDAIVNLANCFDNVFISSRFVDVQWGWFSVVEPELICMQDLLKYKKWKYFINLTGQEWPLKTNADIVKILKAFNGANSMEGTVKRRNVERTQLVHNGYWPTDKKKDSPPPKGITITKGSIHITVSRAFVEYLFNDPIAKEFTEWLKDTGVPDETLFTSLNHSPDLGVPGAYKGEPETDPVKYPFITRFKNWGTYPFDYPCKGQRVRMVCIWSVADLPLLRTRPELFTNKFYLDYEPLAYDCMEELHYNRTREEVLGARQFSTLYYQQLGFVKNHV